MSAKPIFIIGFPGDCPPEIMERAYRDLNKRIGDEYHVLSFFSHKLEDPSFQLLSVENATEIDIELLKKMFLELYEQAREATGSPEEDTHEDF